MSKIILYITINFAPCLKSPLASLSFAVSCISLCCLSGDSAYRPLLERLYRSSHMLNHLFTLSIPEVIASKVKTVHPESEDGSTTTSNRGASQAHPDPELQDGMDYGPDTVLEMSGHEPHPQPGYGGYSGDFGQGCGGGNTLVNHGHLGHQQAWNMQQQNLQQGAMGAHGHPQPFNQSFQSHNNQSNNPNHQYGGPPHPPTYHHQNQGHHGPHVQPQGYSSGSISFNAHGHPRHLPQSQGTYTPNGLWVPQDAEVNCQRPVPVPVTVSRSSNALQGNSGFEVRSTTQEGPLIFMEPANTIPFTTVQGTWYQHPPHKDRAYASLDLNVPAKVPSPLLEIAKAEQPIHNNPNCKFPHPASVACAVCGPPMRIHERFHTMPEALWRPSLEAYARQVQAEGQTTLSPQQPLSDSASKHEREPGSALPSATAPAVPLSAIPAVPTVNLPAIPPPAPPPPATPPPSAPPSTAPPSSMLDNLLLPVTTLATISDPRARFLAARESFERVKALEESSSDPHAPPPRIPNPYLRMRDWAEIIGVNPLPGVGVNIANMNILVRRPDYPPGATGQRRFFLRPPEEIALLSNRTITTQAGNPGEALITTLADSAQGLLNDGSEKSDVDNEANIDALEEKIEAAPNRDGVVVEPALPLTPMEPTEPRPAIVELAIPMATGEVIQREPAVIGLVLPLTPIQLIQRGNEAITPALPLAPAEPTQQRITLNEQPVLPLTPAEPTQQELEAKQQDLPVKLAPMQPAQQAAAAVEPALPLTPEEPTEQEVEGKQPNLPEAPVQPPTPGQEVAAIESALTLGLTPTNLTQQFDHRITDNQQQSMLERDMRTGEVEVHREEQTVRQHAEGPLAAEPATDQPCSAAPSQPEAIESDVYPEPPELSTQSQPIVDERRVFSWASIVAGDRQREHERIRLAAKADGTLQTQEDAEGLDNLPGLPGDALPE
ncbi:hypothetical protein L211DRAFT_867089 [Terfezia boudieri ATCC MYA-4762]|uniref:Uncharacterized protein n=1 Tax=Terfezia boudieri ATCC MYA-4762 TaxID=1051890 RepID=A0A3N4LY41_9PEZI|nr:hypothetical protein L211DRAFT_867089 [Terfezia boudieri ATCC MYA-4762]